MQATAGPQNTLIGATTNSSGVATMDVPSGATPAYTVNVRPPSGYVAGSATTSVPGPGTTSITVNLAKATS